MFSNHWDKSISAYIYIYGNLYDDIPQLEVLVGFQTFLSKLLYLYPEVSANNTNMLGNLIYNHRWIFQSQKVDPLVNHKLYLSNNLLDLEQDIL